MSRKIFFKGSDFVLIMSKGSFLIREAHQAEHKEVKVKKTISLKKDFYFINGECNFKYNVSVVNNYNISTIDLCLRYGLCISSVLSFWNNLGLCLRY